MLLIFQQKHYRFDGDCFDGDASKSTLKGDVFLYRGVTSHESRATRNGCDTSKNEKQWLLLAATRDTAGQRGQIGAEDRKRSSGHCCRQRDP